jgi:hypothetical protein
MARLLIHVEGQTEEDFVNEVLRDHLISRGYELVAARIVGNARLRGRRGAFVLGLESRRTSSTTFERILIALRRLWSTTTPCLKAMNERGLAEHKPGS